MAAYTFGKLALDVWTELGKIQPLHQFPATGGSTTTIVNSVIGNRDIQPDDNYMLDGTAIVVRDAGGANAAPEGEMQRISGYSGANWTYTVDTAFTQAVAAGDIIAIADPDISLYDMLAAANRAMQELGPVEQPDDSLLTIASRTEYQLPKAISLRDIVRVEYQTNLIANDYQFSEIRDFDIVPGVAGSPGTLVLPRYLPSGMIIRITYLGDHNLLASPTSAVYFHPTLAVAATCAHVLKWYNGVSGGNSDYWVQRENQAWNELDRQRSLHPISTRNNAARYLIYSGRPRGGG